MDASFFPSETRSSDAPIRSDEGGGNQGVTTLGFIEGPLLEEAGRWTLGRAVITEGENAGLSTLAQYAPFAALRKLIAKPKTSDKQKKWDGQRVIKVSEAIKLVQEELDGAMGDLKKFSDIMVDMMGGPGFGIKTENLTQRIAHKLRNGALQQQNQRQAFKVVKTDPRGGRPPKGAPESWRYSRRGARGSENTGPVNPSSAEPPPPKEESA